MDVHQFWQLIDDVREQVGDPADADAVAAGASTLIATLPRGEIVAAQQVLWDLMAFSYRAPLLAAARLINGGTSDDGFEYFRGWLITQGCEVFERAVADPDTLAELPVVRAAANDGEELECEDALGIAVEAHLAVTGEAFPTGAFTIRYPELDQDASEEYPLPRLAALYED
ncbi:DUF4240 domain-containing protein [Allokutzneria sp. NRRL B-24872]|uniref:DUF4240 domain-containing protein n=1 Tax=Allokutzneria sp. NRRL B-24872 TaxID=1137961 RepID=UPI000A3B7FFD|nr:DUF4240 domain-containing protein [Allokutzneria sp. NRRL B-24872]